MSSYQLVIHEDAYVRSEAAKAIARAFGKGESFVIQIANFEEARGYLEIPGRECTLAVVSTTAPASATSGSIPGRSDAARDFLRALPRDLPISVVALAIIDDPLVEEVLKGVENSALIPVDFGMLESRARALRTSAPISNSLELEITLKNSEEGVWRIRRGGLKNISDQGALKINANVFNDLLEYSDIIGKFDGAEWAKRVRAIAGKLEQILFDPQNFKMTKAFFGGLGSVGGIENSQILFTMTPEVQKAMVEALREKPDAAFQDFWMLKIPIVRQYESTGGRSPLFTDRKSREEKVNCLIVNADPRAGTLKTAPWLGKLDPLDHAVSEAGDIYRHLKRSAGAVAGIDEVQLLDLSIDPVNALDTLLDKLKERTWHIVHFAGHGVLGEDREKTPGLVLSAADGVVISFARLALALKDPRFLFLSACQTANHEFIGKSIAHSIPVVIGYQWKVDDTEACEFAKKFYESLFDNAQPTFKSIYRALVASRQAAFAREPEGRTWASPVLLTQPLHGAAG